MAHIKEFKERGKTAAHLAWLEAHTGTYSKRAGTESGAIPHARHFFLLHESPLLML